MVPVLTIFASWLLPMSEHWQHIREHLLLRLFANSILLLLGVSFLSFVLGVIPAWLLSQYRIPGSRLLESSLILPMAIPAYVNGFIYQGLFDYSGPVSTFFRSLGVKGQVFDIRSLTGLIFILSLSLFPYVYLMTKQAFASQGSRIVEAGRSLGTPARDIFWRLALPMAKPWIFASLALVAMETLADFGTASIFGVDTFTTAIYKAWFGFFSPHTAAQLSSILLLLAMGILLFEQFSLKRKGFHVHQERRSAKLKFRKRRTAYSCSAFLFVLVGLGFLIPFGQLLVWSIEYLETDLLSSLEVAFNSFTLASLSTLCVLACSLILIFAERFFPIGRVRLANRVAVLGYAFPGTILAIGLYLPLVSLDNFIADSVEVIFSWDPGLIFTGSLGIMVLGLSIRFLAVGHGAIRSAQQRVSKRIDEAAYNFGVYGMKQVKEIHWPILWKSVLGAGVLVFIDVIKEMPLTLMTRPFGWDTLSVRVFELISEGEWERASLPSLLIVLIGLIPVVLFKGEKS